MSLALAARMRDGRRLRGVDLVGAVVREEAVTLELDVGVRNHSTFYCKP